ncbi:MAG: class I SAM-dependent methyltransferase [Chitinophagales bacterium]
MELSPTNTTPKCLFCEQVGHKSTPFEDTVFNNKTFQYIECTNCGLVYVNPLPNADDLNKMYPVEYQGALVTESIGWYKDLLSTIKSKGNFKTLLDYGCGGGRFVIEAMEAGYEVSGTEYNPDLVKNLGEAIPGAKFLTIDDFFKTDAKYDIIFLSNVLEHLTNPKEIMLLLKTRLNTNGIFVLEGPVENNFNLTKYARKSIFWIRKNLFNKKASHTPTHVLYANRKNQEDFLKSIGLETLYYKIDESHWPFPSNYKDCDTMMKKMMFLIADTSVKIGKKFSFWGNNFVYIGKVK